MNQALVEESGLDGWMGKNRRGTRLFLLCSLYSFINSHSKRLGRISNTKQRGESLPYQTNHKAHGADKMDTLIKTDNSILRLDKLKNSHIERFLHLVNFLYNMKGSYSYYFFVLLHNSCFRCSIFRTNFEIPAF